MRLRSVAVVACVASAVLLTRASSPPSAEVRDFVRLPGPVDVLYAAPYDANYSYGPKGSEFSALRAQATAAVTSTWQVTYDATFNLPANALAKAAFQAAVDIWANIITVPASIPIRVNAKFADLGGSQLGSAGPAAICSTSADPNTLYASALANKLNGIQSCGGVIGGQTFDIDASFNGSFPSWEYGTSGTGVAGKYNFMTVVLHELGHGLGFYGSFQVSGGIGNTLNTKPDIYDTFAVTGSGTPLLSFPRPSSALGAQLVSNNTFFNGANAKAANANSNAKLETHDFAFYGFAGTNVFAPGSSYSHLDDVEFSASPNGLQTWQLAANEVYTDPGPVMRGVFKDEGWTVAGTVCPYTLSARSTTAPVAGGAASVTVTTDPTCAWTAVSNSTPAATITGGASGPGNGTVNYTVAANGSVAQRTLTLTIAKTTFTIVQAGTGTPPTMSLDKTNLQFAATTTGAAFAQKSADQTVRILQSGAGTVTWNASANAPWITVSPASGTGAGTLQIGLKFDPSVAGIGTGGGAVTVTFTNANNASASVNVGLKTIQNGTSAAPFGSYDTPANSATGLAGSIGVTGWALDDLGVARVDVCRNPVIGETTGPATPCGLHSLVFIGTAVLVDGARPDVAGQFSTLPRNTQAGWGYLMLTNFLPSQGNGTFQITAIATDVEGKTTVLGTKTITCANNGSLKPFGAIDTPGQGEVVSGSGYLNFGWALAHGNIGATPLDGGSVTALIDGVSIGTPGSWTSRPDLTMFFPAVDYPNVSKALALIGINTTTLANGVHTIFWVVTADNGETDGIGSRFFSVANSSLIAASRGSLLAARDSWLEVESSPQTGSLRLEAPALLVPEGRTSRLSLVDEVNGAALEGTAISGRRGYDLTAPLQSYPVTNGRAALRGEELDRIELQLGGAGYTGYMRTGDELGPLPIGSRLDEATGTFTWGIGVGFVHDYDLVFVRWANGRAIGRQEIRITLGPKQSNLVGPQVLIDAPAPNAIVDGAFLLGGWAADLDETVGTGVDTLHVWAYPLGGDDPIFLGATAYGGERPDVAAIFGEQFKKSAYGLIVDSLSPGTYDLAVFAWSTVKNGFVPAKVVRVTVR